MKISPTGYSMKYKDTMVFTVARDVDYWRTKRESVEHTASAFVYGGKGNIVLRLHREHEPPLRPSEPGQVMQLFFTQEEGYDLIDCILAALAEAADCYKQETENG